MPKPSRKPAALTVAGALALLLAACAAPPDQPEPVYTPAESTPRPAGAPLDGRLQVDAQEYPWSAIGRVNLAGRGFCNGILIGPRLVLTQARCLYSAREGRWYSGQELHFIAAYQRDDYLANSPVTRFTVAPGFNPRAGVSLANLTNNWAVIQLREPVGQQTGWLGINWDDVNRTRGNVPLSAGYRSDLPHAVNIHYGCAPRGGAIDLCAATPAERALPTFVLVDGELRVMGEYYTRSVTESPRLLEVARQQNGGRLAAPRGPSAASQVGQRPTATVTSLLEALGYTVTRGDLSMSVAAFRRDHGLPAGEAIDLTLLAALLQAAYQTPTS